MALVGHAASVVNGTVVVVRVDVAPGARALLSAAAVSFTTGLAVAWSMDTVPYGRLVALLFVLGTVVEAMRGIVRARMYVGARCVDTVRWSFRAPPALSAVVAGRTIGASVSGGGDRRVSFAVDGAGFAVEELV